MTWWAWTLLWIVLVAGAALVIYLAVRKLLRQGAALVRELGDAADMLAEVTRALEARPGEESAAEPVAAPRRHRSARSSSTRGSSSRRRQGAASQDVR